MSGERCTCVTCGDVAEPMTVVALDGPDGLAWCTPASGERVAVELGLVDGAAPGACVLVHAGVALALVGDGTR